MQYSNRVTCFWTTKSRGSSVTVFDSRNTFMATLVKSSTSEVHCRTTTKMSRSFRGPIIQLQDRPSYICLLMLRKFCT